ncbi:MAG TPA: NUDIX domain-containing protein [Candidatus Izemoplasmatales bacterium]|nr:NUDIX domain-containing protein [Candidatus Izemoplasmatales bacterium]
MLTEKIQAYHPKNEQEEADQRLILDFLSRNPDALYRSNLAAHITSSAIVVDESMTKVLFAFHNIYRSWSWVGGHNDGEEDSLAVAVRETKEETGVQSVRPWSEDIWMIDSVYVHNHIKHGHYVPDHLHLNLTYLLIADDHEEVRIKADENSGVRWFPIAEVMDHIGEERMKAIYQKAFDAIAEIRNIRK